MKQYLITFFVILSTITKFTYGQESWVPFNGGTEGDVELNILTSNTSEVLFTVNIPGMYVKDEMGYQRLRIEGCGRTDSTGFPELPLISHLIAVPECDSIIYNIQPLDSIILDNYNVYPAPELVEQTNPEGYTYLAEQFVKNDSIYNIDEYYPGYIGDLPVHGYIREQRIAETHLRPVQFNPVQQKLKIYFSIEVHLTFINPVSAVNVETGIFNGVCHTSLINYNAGGISSAINLNSTVSGTVERLTDTNTQYVVCDFLIISADLFFNNSFTDNLA